VLDVLFVCTAPEHLPGYSEAHLNHVDLYERFVDGLVGLRVNAVEPSATAAMIDNPIPAKHARLEASAWFKCDGRTFG
jgi:hypothetical protein